MQAWPAAVAGAAVAAAASALGTTAWIALARRWRVHDEPGQRRMHSQTTPRAGGVAVALAWALASWCACSWAQGLPVSTLSGLLVVAGAFFACGLLDDFHPLPALPKLLMQVAVVALLFTPLLPAAVRADLLLVAVLGLGFLYFVNAWNFMDGSNGMIACQTVVVALALATWPRQEAELVIAALALAGACLGFLPFNLPNARVFLGDSGSFFLGSAIFLLLAGSCAFGTLQPVQALLLVSVVLIDTALTLSWRIYRGRKFWKAHREHLFQLAVRKGYSHASVALAYAAATALAWLLARYIGGEPSGIVRYLIPTLAWGCGVAAYVVLRRRWLGRTRSVEGRT